MACHSRYRCTYFKSTLTERQVIPIELSGQKYHTLFITTAAAFVKSTGTTKVILRHSFVGKRLFDGHLSGRNV